MLKKMPLMKETDVMSHKVVGHMIINYAISLWLVMFQQNWSGEQNGEIERDVSSSNVCRRWDQELIPEDDAHVQRGEIFHGEISSRAAVKIAPSVTVGDNRFEDWHKVNNNAVQMNHTKWQGTVWPVQPCRGCETTTKQDSMTWHGICANHTWRSIISTKEAILWLCRK